MGHLGNGAVEAMAFLWILIISSAPLWASDANRSLAPIVVEAERTQPLPVEVPTVQVTEGAGAKVIDSPVNELGIELRSMDGAEDLSVERRQDDWWLFPRRADQNWLTQVRADLSFDQKAKGRVLGTVWGQDLNLELGVHRDHRNIAFVNGGANPYDLSDDVVETRPNHVDVGYVKLGLEGRSWKSLADGDLRFADVRAGNLMAGRRRRWQTGLSGEWRIGDFRTRPFLQFREDQFDSQVSPLFTNDTQGNRQGVQLEGEIASLILLRADLSRESMSRGYTDGTRIEFRRYRLKGIAKVAWLTNRWVEVQGHSFVETARDELSATSQNAMPILWDLGAEVASSSRFPWGVSAKVRRYALMPTPLQRFGDGALLAGAPDLPAEEGERFSAGVWWKDPQIESSIAGFFGQARNSPLMVAVSPTQVRTVAVGGVWTAGLEFSNTLRVWRLSFSNAYSFQDAVNASQINWQRGQRIPGRPQWVIRNEAKYEHAGLKFGVVHRYRSEDATDLSGLWFRPATHQIDSYVGYGEKNWEIRLLANNLIQDWNLPQNPEFRGTAAPNLLEPFIQQTEVRVQCEVMM